MFSYPSATQKWSVWFQFFENKKKYDKAILKSFNFRTSLRSVTRQENFPKILLESRPGGFSRRPWRGFWLWWARLAFWLGAYRVPVGNLDCLGDHLGASWQRLGGILDCSGASFGATWAISGCLENVLVWIFYQNGRKLRLSISNGMVHSIFDRFLIDFSCSGTLKIIQIYCENNTFWLLGKFEIRSFLKTILVSSLLHFGSRKSRKWGRGLVF